jgi:hypothetical protein
MLCNLSYEMLINIRGVASELPLALEWQADSEIMSVGESQHNVGHRRRSGLVRFQKGDVLRRTIFASRKSKRAWSCRGRSCWRCHLLDCLLSFDALDKLTKMLN